MEQLTEEEKKALRGSKFAPLPSAPSSSSSGSQPRLAHPGGPMKTNKAAALAKFLERKLQDPNGLSSLDPRLIEVAVKNAKETLQSSSGRTSVQHVDSFGDSEEFDEDEEMKSKKNKKRKKKKKKLKKEKQRKKFEESSGGMVKKPKKKLKLAS